MNKSKNVSYNKANSKSIILDADTLEKTFTDRDKDWIKWREAINDKMQEMEKMDVKKKQDKINGQPAPKNLQEHDTKTASSEQTTLLPGANVLCKTGRNGFQQQS